MGVERPEHCHFSGNPIWRVITTERKMPIHFGSYEAEEAGEGRVVGKSRWEAKGERLL